MNSDIANFGTLILNHLGKNKWLLSHMYVYYTVNVIFFFMENRTS